MSLLTPDEVRDTMPCVGDELMRKPTFYYRFYSQRDAIVERPCVVTYVHPEHLWYSVRFTQSGIVESYKLPELRIGPGGRLLD